MSAFRALLPAAAFAVGAFAASSCSTSGTLTVTNTADTASISGCSTYSGSIAIATGASAIALDGPKRITGDVVALSGGSLTSLEADNLEIIDGALNLTNLGSLGTINIPNLTQVTTFFVSQIGQSLLSLNFGVPGIIQSTNFTLDDTYLQSLTGINLTTAGSISITNNQLIQNLTLSLVNTTGDIIIRGNSDGLNVDLNNLLSTASLQIYNCNNIAIDSLQNATGLISFISNGISTLSMPNLTNAAGGLAIQSNPSLNNISVPALQTAQSINVNDNSDLTGNVTFPSLTLINGAVNMTGSYSGVSMPKLKHVDGVFNVSSSSDLDSTCSVFSNEKTVFAITPVCKGSTTTSGGGTTTGSGGATTSSTNAAQHYYGTSEVNYSVFGLLAAIIGLLM